MNDTRNHIEQELREMQSSLANRELKNPEVPEGFFEQLERDIIAKTLGVKDKPRRAVEFTLLKYVASIAAALAVVFIGINLFSNKQPQSLELQLAGMNEMQLRQFMEDQIAAISAEDLHQYINENIDDIDVNLFSETELIDNDYTQENLIEDVNLEILSDGETYQKEEPLLDEELLDQIDDETIEQLLNDESMFDDFAL